MNLNQIKRKFPKFQDSCLYYYQYQQDHYSHPSSHLFTENSWIFDNKQSQTYFMKQNQFIRTLEEIDFNKIIQKLYYKNKRSLSKLISNNQNIVQQFRSSSQIEMGSYDVKNRKWVNFSKTDKFIVVFSWIQDIQSYVLRTIYPKIKNTRFSKL